MDYYLCMVCGNLVEKVEDGENTPSCCGRQMRKLYSESTDGALEKHVPLIKEKIKVDDNVEKLIIEVGSVEHPMEETHYIKWIAVDTATGYHLVKLKPQDKAQIELYLPAGEKINKIYAYCNLHGLYEN